jgi:hypothetical protein
MEKLLRVSSFEGLKLADRKVLLQPLNIKPLNRKRTLGKIFDVTVRDKREMW